MFGACIALASRRRALRSIACALSRARPSLTPDAPRCSAAAMRGKSVLVLDGAASYGGTARSLNLDELRAWAARQAPPGGQRSDAGAASPAQPLDQAESSPQAEMSQAEVPLRSVEEIYLNVRMHEAAQLGGGSRGSSRAYAFDLGHQARHCGD